MREIKFESDKEELEFYRDRKKKSWEIQDEIHDLLGVSKESTERLYLIALGKTDLILLKNAIKKLKEIKQ